MTSIRIDRYLQSTILFSKMSAPRLGSLRDRSRLRRCLPSKARYDPADLDSRRVPASAGSRVPWNVVFSTTSSSVPLTLRHRAGSRRSPYHDRWSSHGSRRGCPWCRPATVRPVDRVSRGEPPQRVNVSGRTRRPQAFRASRVKRARASAPGAPSSASCSFARCHDWP
jgi:hypothetical protein